MMDSRHIDEKQINKMLCSELLDLTTILEDDKNCDFDELLKYCKENEIRLRLYGRETDAQWLMEIRNLIMTQHWDKMRKAQQQGIEQALIKKEEGKGAYGRPNVKLPDDFENQVMKRIQHHESLSVYCEEIQMKKSTFYKYVNELKQEWKNTKN